MVERERETRAVLEEVERERERQESLVGIKFAATCASLKLSQTQKLAVLAEEFGEVAHHIAENVASVHCNELRGYAEAYEMRKRALREELIQVAAVAVAWAESLDP